MPPTIDDWTWPAPSALGNDTNNDQRWHWHFVSAGRKVSAWKDFSKQSSLQLQQVLSHWESRCKRKPVLRVESGDQQLSDVWRDLGKDGHQVECVCYDGRHGGLMQVTAPKSDGWLEICRVYNNAKTEYPWMWHWNPQVNAYIVNISTPIACSYLPALYKRNMLICP